MTTHAQKGSILLLALVFFGFFFAISTALISRAVTYGQTVHHTIVSEQALALAEAGMDTAVSALNQSGTYTGETNTSLSPGTFTVTVQNIGVDEKKVTVTASVPNSTNPTVQKTVTARLKIDTSAVAFHYGVQAGTDGFSLTGGSTINGSVYSNGDISATTGVHITGSATARGLIGGNTYTTGAYVGTGGVGDAWANTLKGVTVAGTAYCQTATYSNKSCNTSKGIPPVATLPLEDDTINDWKSEAEAGGTITGDYHVDWHNATIGPRKIVGNLLVDGGGTLTMSGNLWVTGTVTVTSGAKVKLASTYADQNGVIVSDGYVSLSGGANLVGSGQTGSNLFFVTTSSCPSGSGCSGNDAITLSGGAGSVGLVAQNGTVYVNGGTTVKTVTAKKIQMDGGATLNYDTGLADANFESDSGGSWQVEPGTYSTGE